jgi:hypothetical protein
VSTPAGFLNFWLSHTLHLFTNMLLCLSASRFSLVYVFLIHTHHPVMLVDVESNTSTTFAFDVNGGYYYTILISSALSVILNDGLALLNDVGIKLSIYNLVLTNAVDVTRFETNNRAA